LSETYLSYGIGLDLGIVKVMYVAYTEELGVSVGQDPEQRQMAQVNLKLGF
jgi:hypothetical protein